MNFIKFLMASILILGLSYIWIKPHQSNDLTDEQKLTPFVQKELSEGAYWFEMQNFVGKWDKMMLVFGYVDDFSVCNELVDFASKASPHRKFRCVRIK